jgi:hypothetical protein
MNIYTGTTTKKGNISNIGMMKLKQLEHIIATTKK